MVSTGLQRLGYKFELKGGTSLFTGFKFIRARRTWALLLRRGAMMRQPATCPNWAMLRHHKTLHCASRALRSISRGGPVTLR